MVHPCPRGAPPPVPASSVPTQLRGKIEEEELTDETVVTLICVLFMRLLAKNGGIPMPSWEEEVSVFFSVTSPNIETLMYVRRLVQYAHCSRSAFICAAVYLDRLEQEYPLLALTELNMHRLFITALMIAAKSLDDRCYSNAHYARVGGISTVQELNRLELYMLKFLKFQTYVYREEYVSFVHQLSEHRVPKISIELGNRICQRYSMTEVSDEVEKSLGLQKVRRGAELIGCHPSDREGYGTKEASVDDDSSSSSVYAAYSKASMQVQYKQSMPVTASPGLPLLLSPAVGKMGTKLRTMEAANVPRRTRKGESSSERQKRNGGNQTKIRPRGSRHSTQRYGNKTQVAAVFVDKRP